MPIAGTGRTVLALDEVRVDYGGVVAVDRVSLEVGEGQIVGLIGPNGAGKTTLIDAISGYAASTGSVLFEGSCLDGLVPHRRIRRGLGRTFQGVELYDDLTVEENIRVGQEAARHGGHRVDLDPEVDDLTTLCRMLRLDAVRDRPVKELSAGYKQLVSVARALAGRPSVVLLDEPAGGLDSDESQWLGERLRDVRAAGVTILMVDHDMSLVLGVCDEIHVLDLGRRHRVGPAGPDPDRSPGGRGLPGQHPRARGGRRMTALGCVDLAAGYAGKAVVRGFDCQVNEGEVVALLGPNGAGKTTVLLTLAGLLPRVGGEVELFGEPAPDGNPVGIAKKGLVLVPDDRSLFTTLTTRQNIELGRRKGSMPVADVLDFFPELGKRLDIAAGMLSGGEQQMLAMARGLVQQPRILLIDELSMGLAPVIVEKLLPIVRRVATETRAAVLLVEQHVQLALGIADRGVVLVHGEVAVDEAASTLLADVSRVERAYLGDHNTSTA